MAEKQLDSVTLCCVCVEESDCWWSRGGPAVALLLTLWVQRPVAALLGNSVELTVRFSRILDCQKVI